MPPPDILYLRHMLDALNRLEEYVKRTTREEFEKDPLMQDGFIRQITILGEAAGRVSRELVKTHDEIPWPDITGVRHKLIHDYFVVDIDVVWITATEDAPGLRPLVEAVLETLI